MYQDEQPIPLPLRDYCITAYHGIEIGLTLSNSWFAFTSMRIKIYGTIKIT